jgi:colanic acid/amylovoran biosynthesis protein
VKVVITNAVTLNGGDAAILRGVMHVLRSVRPEARFTVFDSQAETASRYYPDIDYQTLLYDTVESGRTQRLHLWRLLGAAALKRRGAHRAADLLTSRSEGRALQAYAEADLVVSTGGTYLVEHYDIRHRLFEFALCRAMGKPVVFFTQSLGPFRDPKQRRQLRRAFDASPLVLVRDEQSQHHLLDLGVDPAKIHVLADAVFALADEDTLARAAGRTLPATRSLRVAISVRHWDHFRGTDSDAGMARYVAALASLADHLVSSRGAEVEFLSTCQGIGEYWTHDTETADRVVGAMKSANAERVTVNRGFHQPTALGEIFAGFDLVVATRMHAAILALNAGTPVLPIAYEFKTEELFDRLGAASWVTRIEDMDPQSIVARVESLFDELPERRAVLFEGVAEERKRALIARDLLMKLLG